MIERRDHEERRLHFRFDRTVNISNVLSILILVATLIRYGNDVISYLKDINVKTNIMWSYFAKDHPEVNQLLNSQEER